jgi:hypothetical protein
MKTKNILIAAALALHSFASFGTTPSPVSLLNTAGSTAGQAILSSGPTSTAAWASIVDSVIAGSGIAVSAATGNATVSVATNGVALGQLAQQAANTVLANATGSTANVTAFSMPTCSTSVSALNWTSGTGFTCNAAVNAATLAGATFASPPVAGYGSATPEPVAATTISATGLISPASTIGIKGTATNDSAQVGSLGEFPTPTNLTGVSLTVFVVANTSSVSLTAGNWIMQCGTAFAPTGSTVVQSLTVGISPTSATLGSAGTFTTAPGNPTAGSGNPVIWSPLVDIKLASTTTEFCVASSNFSASTMTAGGFIRAWRLR